MNAGKSASVFKTDMGSQASHVDVWSRIPGQNSGPRILVSSYRVNRGWRQVHYDALAVALNIMNIIMTKAAELQLADDKWKK